MAVSIRSPKSWNLHSLNLLLMATKRKKFNGAESTENVWWNQLKNEAFHISISTHFFDWWSEVVSRWVAIGFATAVGRRFAECPHETFFLKCCELSHSPFESPSITKIPAGD
jgi:hypothetical protein